MFGAPNHLNPISHYVASKLAAEGKVNKILALPGNHGRSLRFFHIAETLVLKLLDKIVENLLPIVINKLKANLSSLIYGTDNQNPDGTCIRDNIDVRNIANTHPSVAESTCTLPLAMNFGTGRGSSVR